MAVQASWNLDSTADSLIGISRNGLAAATTDDVQPIALVACEKFGATLAMSQETIHKIQVSVIPTPSPAILRFLKVSVGYKANDCVNYFGQNAAGLRFLGLACALATIEDQYKAATMLQAMLESSTDDKRLLPTARQLQKLLAALEPRCHRAGFIDEVIGWDLLFKSQTSERKIRDPLTAPDGAAINSVVDALRQLNRLGNADITSITIKTGQYAAWLCAFVKWSVGYPPTVTCTNDSPILKQPGSKVTMVIPLKAEDINSLNVVVTVYTLLKSPSRLITPTSPISIVGMMRLALYGRTMLQSARSTSETAKKAFREAMPYALSTIIYMVQIHGVKAYKSGLGEPRNFDNVKSIGEASANGALALPLCPFPEKSVISRMFEILFEMKIEPLPATECFDIFSLHHTALYVAGCSCSPFCPQKYNLYFKSCLKRNFAELVSAAVMDVLTLSLVSNPDDLLVSPFAHYTYGSRDELSGKILSALCNPSDIQDMTGLDFVERVYLFLAHDTQRVQVENKVISSGRGQAAWLTVYETMVPANHGYLSFSWHTGHICYRQETFDSVSWSERRRNHLDPFLERANGMPVWRPCNLYPEVQMQWTVFVDKDQLHVRVTLGNGKEFDVEAGFGQGSLDALTKVVVVEQCQHHHDAELEGYNHFLSFTGPIEPRRGNGEICIVAVDNDDKLGFVALNNFDKSELVMVRKGACINCCISQCRRFSSRLLIL